MAAVIALAMAAAGVLALPEAASAVQSLGRVKTGEPAPDFTLRGSDGRQHRLSSHRGKIVVLEWMSPACNYTAAKYASGEMQRLQREAARRGVVWLSVNTTGSTQKPGYLTQRKARDYIRRHNASPRAILLDTGADVGRRYGARTTPSFFIIGKDGRLAYQGAIDDDVFANGQATRNYVTETLAALAAGRAPAVSETRPYGCAVEY